MKAGLDAKKSCVDVHKRMSKHLEFGAIQTDSTEGRDVKGKRKREANVLSLGWASTRLELPVTHPVPTS